jgi:hypothetical protein
MSNVRVATNPRNDMLNKIRDRIDAGSGAGTIKFYTGTQPANANAATSGNTLLGTLTFSDPSAGDAASGVLTFSAITQDTSADADGTATWARIADSDGNTVFDCDVGGTHESTTGTIQLNTSAIVTGGPIQISSFTLTYPAT